MQVEKLIAATPSALQKNKDGAFTYDSVVYGWAQWRLQQGQHFRQALGGSDEAMRELSIALNGEVVNGDKKRMLSALCHPLWQRECKELFEQQLAGLVGPVHKGMFMWHPDKVQQLLHAHTDLAEEEKQSRVILVGTLFSALR